MCSGFIQFDHRENGEVKLCHVHTNVCSVIYETNRGDGHMVSLAVIKPVVACSGVPKTDIGLLSHQLQL